MFVSEAVEYFELGRHEDKSLDVCAVEVVLDDAAVEHIVGAVVEEVEEAVAVAEAVLEPPVPQG